MRGVLLGRPDTEDTMQRHPIRVAILAGLLALAAAAIAASPASAAAPPNDNFASATTLSGASFSQAGTTLAATMEMGEPDHANSSFDGTLGTDCDTTFDAQCEHSVWYSWTAPSNMTLNLQTCASDYDTTLAVYTGTTVGGLTEKASNDDALGETDACGGDDASGLGRALSFNVASGTVYKIAVAGFEGDSGPVTLTTAAVPQAPPPVVTPPVVTPPVIPPAATTGQKKHHHKHHKHHKHHHHHHHG